MRLFWRVPWDLTANFMRVGKTATTWSFGATYKAIALVITAQILSEYWNNRNLLMSKNESLFQKSKRALFSSLTIFYLFANIHARWILTASTWSFCATYKAIALVCALQILPEYWNNRNLLMSKTESIFKNPRGIFLAHHFLLFHMRLFWRVWDLIANFMRVGKTATTSSL